MASGEIGGVGFGCIGGGRGEEEEGSEEDGGVVSSHWALGFKT